MAIPLSYSMRNLWKRRLTTILTVSGMALVVFVFAAVLMMAAGLQKTLVETGSDDNVVVFRKGSTSEVMSGIERGQASIVEMLPQVAIGGEGRRLVAKEVVVLIALPKRGAGNFQRRGPRRPGGVDPAAAAGEARRGAPVPDGIVGDHRRQQHRQGVHGGRPSGNPELGDAEMDRGGHLRCGKYRLQFRDLGGRGPGDAGLPPARLLIARSSN